MAGLQVTSSEFLTEVRISRRSHILLEGSRDRAFFTTMVQVANTGSELESTKRIVIDTAERIKSEGDIQGNRQKVETISALISNRTYADRFVGFVDREFRDFSWNTAILDKQKQQYHKGRLIWSRGHSIENYLFDYQVVQQVLYDCTPDGDTAVRALECLRENFAAVLAIGCALGLCAFEANALNVIRRTVHWRSIAFQEGKVAWDVDAWKVAMAQNSGLDASTRDELATQFTNWLKVIEVSDPIDVKWACDGHIGLNLIWNAYAQLIYHVRQHQSTTGPSATNQRNDLFNISDQARFNFLARRWAQNNKSPIQESPAMCFHLLESRT